MSANSQQVPAAAATPARPRVRYTAIVFGAIACGIGVFGMIMAANAAARESVFAWVGTLTPVTAALAGFIALGVLVLVVAGLSLVRAGQRRSERAQRIPAADADAAPAAWPLGDAEPSDDAAAGGDAHPER